MKLTDHEFKIMRVKYMKASVAAVEINLTLIIRLCSYNFKE